MPAVDPAVLQCKHYVKSEVYDNRTIVRVCFTKFIIDRGFIQSNFVTVHRHKGGDFIVLV